VRAMSVLRFVLFGAVGFGSGWTLLGVFGGGFAVAGGVGLVLGGAIFSGDLPALALYALVLSVSGAFGGAMLGLSLRDGRKAAVMALLGAVGFFFGSFVVAGLFFLPFLHAGYGSLEAVSAAALGLAVSATLSLALQSWRGTAVLALMGLVGFGTGGVIAAALQGFPLQPLEGSPSWQDAAFGAIEGLIGGASLGAALGYLEYRKPAPER